MAAASLHRGRADGRAAALGGAVLAHAALLAPLALGALGLEFERVEDGAAPVLLIQLESKSRPGPAASVVAPSAAEDGKPPPSSLPSAPVQHHPLLTPTAPLFPSTSPPGDARWTVQPLPEARPGPVLNCRAALSDETSRRLCAERLSARANTTAPINGSGAPNRDARFVAEGAAALAGYEAKRAPLGEPDEPECTNIGPITDCGVNIKVKLFSSRDGVLPSLRRRQ